MTVDRIAEDYVKLVLAVGQHDAARAFAVEVSPDAAAIGRAEHHRAGRLLTY